MIDVKSPEQKLWNAVLVQAYTDLTDRNPKIRESAKAWFFKNRMGLEEICKAIGCSASHARKRAVFILRHRKDKKIKRWFAESGKLAR